MIPFLLMAQITGAAFVSGAAFTLLMKKLAPKSSDFAAGAIHFSKAVQEFQKGFTAVLFGESGQALEAIKAKKESSRIPIE